MFPDDPAKVKEPYLGDQLSKDLKNSRGAYHCKKCDCKLIDVAFEVLHEDPESKKVDPSCYVLTYPRSQQQTLSSRFPFHGWVTSLKRRDESIAHNVIP